MWGWENLIYCFFSTSFLSFAIHFLSHLLFDFSDVSQTSITGEQYQLLGTVLQRTPDVCVCVCAPVLSIFRQSKVCACMSTCALFICSYIGLERTV